jgi:hypothetical protein
MSSTKPIATHPQSPRQTRACAAAAEGQRPPRGASSVSTSAQCGKDSPAQARKRLRTEAAHPPAPAADVTSFSLASPIIGTRSCHSTASLPSLDPTADPIPLLPARITNGIPVCAGPRDDSGVELLAYDPDCDVELISPDLSAEPLVLDSHQAQRTDETHVPITTVSPELLTAAARRYSMIDGLVVSALVSRMNASQKSNCVVIDPSTASRFLIRDDATAPELRVREDTAAEVTRSRRAAIVAHVGHPEAGHYICICVDPAERKVVVYDSLPTVDAFSVAIANIAHAVQSRIPGSAELTYAVDYPRQAAGSNDCALYALNQAWRFTSGGEFGLTRDNIRDRLTDAAHALPTPSAPPQQGPFADTRPPARPSPEGMEHSPATAPTVTALQKNALKCAGAERTARGVAEVEEATSRMRIESARSRANRPLCGAETESGRCTYPPRPGKTTCDRHDPDLAVPEQDAHRAVAAWEAEVQLLKSQIDAKERLLVACWTRVEIIKQLHWHEQQHQQHQHTPPPLGYLDANSPLPARKLRTPRKHLAGQRESSRIADASTTTCVARFEKAQTPAEWHRIAMGRREHLTADDVEKLRRRVSACGPGCVLYAVWKADDYCYFGRAPVVERNGSLFLQFDRVGDLPPDLPLDGQLHPSRHSTLLWVQVFARDTRHPCVVAPDAFAPSRGRDTIDGLDQLFRPDRCVHDLEQELQMLKERAATLYRAMQEPQRVLANLLVATRPNLPDVSLSALRTSRAPAPAQTARARAASYASGSPLPSTTPASGSPLPPTTPGSKRLRRTKERMVAAKSLLEGVKRIQDPRLKANRTEQSTLASWPTLAAEAAKKPPTGTPRRAVSQPITFDHATAAATTPRVAPSKSAGRTTPAVMMGTPARGTPPARSLTPAASPIAVSAA